MHIENEIVEQVAQMVFSTMLGIDLFPQSDHEAADYNWMQAGVRISGPWNASVSIKLSPSLAEVSAHRMLNSGDDLTLLDQEEVALELANQIGGNLKSILPAPSVLSIPSTRNPELTPTPVVMIQNEVWLGGPEGNLQVQVVLMDNGC